MTAIILAAGLSQRMGCNKLLLKARDGNQIISQVLMAIASHKFDEYIIVTSDDEVSNIAADYGFRIIINSNPQIGQSMSVKLGVNASDNKDGWLFISGDMPCIKADTILSVISAAKLEDKITVPIYNNRPGQPVFFPYRYKAELLSLQGDEGGRQIIRAHMKDVLYINIEDYEQGTDIDTPQEYRTYINKGFINE